MLLDFEKPIAALEAKLIDMNQLASDSDKEVQAAVKALEKKIHDLKKETFENLTGWQRVQLSRHPDRPYTLDYIYEITTDFIELHGDRAVGDDKAMVGGFGSIDGKTFMLIGQQKGRNTKQRQMRNFGMANPEGYRKALRLMKIAEKFNKPIVTFIDTPGAYPGLEAEERGQGEAIARNLKEMFGIKVPVICIIIGEGASGGALGIAIGDRVLIGMGAIIMDGAIVEPDVIVGGGSVVSPGKTLTSGGLFVGSPAKLVRALRQEELEFLRYSAKHYVKLKDLHLSASKQIN